jgi:hypothetical protein
MRAGMIIAVVYLFLCPAVAAGEPGGSSEVVTPAAHQASDEVDHVAVLESYLVHFFEHTNGRLLKRAKGFVPQVIAAATQEGLDPLLLAVVISCESTWRPASVGKVGEVGLMQVHGEAALGFDVETIDGNLAAGAHWLASRIAKYGTVERGMTHYMGASPRAIKAATWRVKLYRDELLRQGIPEG